jgi:hypothetical protein
MPQLRLKVSRERAKYLELDTLIAMEEGQMTTRACRDLVAVFVTDERGEYLPDDEAQKAAGKLRAVDLADVFDRITKEFRELAIPPATGSS